MPGGLARRNINLTRLESRAKAESPWEYLFYLDIEGHSDNPRVNEALDEVSSHANTLKVLGCYPRRSAFGEDLEPEEHQAEEVRDKAPSLTVVSDASLRRSGRRHLRATGDHRSAAPGRREPHRPATGGVLAKSISACRLGHPILQPHLLLRFLQQLQRGTGWPSSSSRVRYKARELGAMKDEGLIMLTGRGRGAKWKRLGSS